MSSDPTDEDWLTDDDRAGVERGLCGCRKTDPDCSCYAADAFGLTLCWCVREGCPCTTEVGFVAD